MPGMGGSYGANNPLIVWAFHSALIHQGLVVLAILAIVGLTALAVNAARIQRRARSSVDTTEPVPREAPGRQMLRFGFGALWVLDGVLQTQTAMPIELPTQVVGPSATGSPHWVHVIVYAGITIWNNHPIAAAAATVWIQIGIGIFLLVAPAERWSRIAGAVSAGWGLLVWIFGESFGSIFAPGATWLFGAPGAALFYVVAGGIVALPERQWSTGSLGRWTLRGLGSFFFGMGVLQAWPARGFWQGHASRHAAVGALTSMTDAMAKVSQPEIFSSWISHFGSFDASHGFAVNLSVVIALVSIGIALASGNVAAARVGLGAAVVVCLADWVLVEDFGFFGGVGTDPNSMIPMLVLIGSAFVAVTHAPAQVPNEVGSPARATLQTPLYLIRLVAAVGAVGVILVGALPMALASTNPHADPILTEALNGTPSVENAPAPDFRLLDERAMARSLLSWSGKTVVLTFLDPVCTSDCPLIAQELRQIDVSLGVRASSVEFVAIDANPVDRSYEFVDAFDQQEHLGSLENWHFLTGSLPELEQIWNAYGVQVEVSPAGAMISHSDIVYVITPRSTIYTILNADPGSGTRALTSSFTTLLGSEIARAERS